MIRIYVIFFEIFVFFKLHKKSVLISNYVKGCGVTD